LRTISTNGQADYSFQLGRYNFNILVSLQSRVQKFSKIIVIDAKQSLIFGHNCTTKMNRIWKSNENLEF